MEKQNDFTCSGDHISGRVRMSKALVAAGTFGLVALTAIYMFLKWTRDRAVRGKPRPRNEVDVKKQTSNLKSKRVKTGEKKVHHSKP